jgi:hypothetical protein
VRIEVSQRSKGGILKTGRLGITTDDGGDLLSIGYLEQTGQLETSSQVVRG